MPQNVALIGEIRREAESTRKVLERVPTDKNDWKPHAKSMEMGRLAGHVAELTGWVTMIMATDELDWANFPYKPFVAETTAELLEKVDENVMQAVAILETCKDEDFEKMWTMRNGDHVIFSMPKHVVLRSFAMSHQYHHRAQLGVYLRLLDIPVPGMYGPTADDVPAPMPEEAAASVN